MNRLIKRYMIKKVFLFVMLLTAHQVPAYCLYSSWEYASSFFSRSNPELDNNNNINSTPEKVHQSEKFLIAGTATQAKANGSNNVSFKTPLVEEPINKADYWLFALFDGINGDIVSQYLKRNILLKIREYAPQNESLNPAIQRAIDSFHETFLAKNEFSGSSILLAIIDMHKKLIIAHAGNSLAVLKTDDQHQLLTTPHTLRNKYEFERVHYSFVQKIETHPKPYLSSYKNQSKGILYVTNLLETDEEPPVIQPVPIDAKLYACNIIANTMRPNTSYTSWTTRGVGQAHFCPNFISRLDIQEIKLNQLNRFIILGTAGLWGVISPQAAVNIVEECIEQEMRNGKDIDEKNLCPQFIAQTLVNHAWHMMDHKSTQNFNRNEDNSINLTHDNDIAVTLILFPQNIYRRANLL